ncbi:T6SS phospholipase effector Tle1-like catalytic domain-containing protein [Marinobacter sp. W-8]|uniref:T6SS phospholipase effector Tle1-like catalytic domain-containing protein n=1 Tax=Marinobacter sp. W-8 TaxID=3369658 RepID=UPI0037C9E109
MSVCGPASAPGREKAGTFRKNYALADISRIHFIGVFDTVGALGIPAPFLGSLGSDKYLFQDTEPSSIINHARHAVAIRVVGVGWY